MQIRLFPALLFFATHLAPTLHAQAPAVAQNAPPVQYQDARPWTRLWWFADTTTQELITQNLDYLKEKGFGGVECAFIYQYNRKDTIKGARFEWLSPAFAEKVRFCKSYANKIGLGCDLTFGTLWPFGDEHVPKEEASVCLKDPAHSEDMRYIWSHPKPGLVIDHLNKDAFRHYADRLAPAFQPAINEQGMPTSLFVDSWEVTARYLGTSGFEQEFYKSYRYHLRPYLDSLYIKKYPFQQVLYDYRKLVSDYVLLNFYREFTNSAHQSGAYSRGQAAGAPCDLMDAYAALDVPESEALLYEPGYAAIPAAAAALSGKKVVSSETFTCLYGFPAEYFKKEQTADLKLLADAVFANGVNQIIWHGKPLARTEKDTFYATVHIGPSGALDGELKGFNDYMTTVSREMRKGSSYAKVAVYLPTEDAWINGELPVTEQKIWSWGYYEMRENKFPEALLPWRPMWVNQTFLSKGTLENQRLTIGDVSFSALYVDAEYLDFSTLVTLATLAGKGFPIVLKRQPKLPGMSNEHSMEYPKLLEILNNAKNVHKTWKPLSGNIKPVVSGKALPEYWCRETTEGLTIFFAHPKSRSIKFPLHYGQSWSEKTIKRRIKVQYNGHATTLKLEFDPYQSVLLKMDRSGACRFENIRFAPKTPKVLHRVKKQYERWEVDPGKYTGACH